MIRQISRWLHSPEKLAGELNALQHCDSDTLPVLVIDASNAYIDKPKGASRSNIDYALAVYDAVIPHYKDVLVQHPCSVITVCLREPNRYDQMVDKPVLRGIQFDHADGSPYIYWSWLHPDKRLKYFARDLFDAMARQGLDHRTVDNFRIDYRAGRIYQHKLPF